MGNEKKSVESFRKKYKLKKVSKEKISEILESQGYTVILYSRFHNSERVDFLISSLGLMEYITLVVKNRCLIYSLQ